MGLDAEHECLHFSSQNLDVGETCRRALAKVVVL